MRLQLLHVAQQPHGQDNTCCDIPGAHRGPCGGYAYTDLPAYLTAALTGFVGLILLIIFVGWVVSIACSCRGRHWIHGADVDPSEMARIRYAKGEISKKEYEDIVKTLKSRT